MDLKSSALRLSVKSVADARSDPRSPSSKVFFARQRFGVNEINRPQIIAEDGSEKPEEVVLRPLTKEGSPRFRPTTSLTFVTHQHVCHLSAFIFDKGKIVAGTESLYNVKKYGNPVNRLRTFVFTKEVTVYYGKVTGGKGYQVLFPKEITPCSVLKLVADVALL